MLTQLQNTSRASVSVAEFAYMDDFSLEGEANTAAANVENITEPA